MSSTKTLRLFGQSERLLRRVSRLDEYRYESSERHREASVGRANVVTSLCPDGTHRPVLDLDFGAHLTPSSTPGHHHLFLDRAIPTEKYLNLLDALAEAGVIEHGYAEASRRRGFSAVRLPWVAKEPSSTGERGGIFARLFA